MNISVPRIVEKQTELRCGKHAINNLFQRRNFATCQNLKKIAKQLSKTYFINVNELVNSTGFYDISVLMTFLIQKKFKIQFSTNINKTNYNKLIGFIIGNGSHWISIRKQFNRFYGLDSCKEKPIEISDLKAWITKYFKNVANSDRAIIKVFE